MPSPKINIVVYTPNDLQAWNLELQGNLEKIKNSQEEILEHKHHLIQLGRSLREKEKKIRWLRTQLCLLRQNNIYWHHHHCHHPFYYDYYCRYKVMDDAALYAIELDLLRLQEECHQVLKQKRLYKNKIAQAHIKIRELKIRNQWLAVHIPAAELFLETLENDPERLVNELKEKILNLINKYEAKHFIRLSPQVRISLLQIHNGLNLLAPNSPNQREQQINYLRLCAFLTDLFERVKFENQDKIFLKNLVTLINFTHIHPQGDLPGRLKTNSCAQTCFKELRNKHPSTFAELDRNLVEIEWKKFMELRDRLLDPLSIPQTLLQQKIIRAAHTLRAEVEDKIRKNKVIDFYFYTRIAENLCKVYTNPEDMEATANLAQIAKYTTGAASIGKKLAGSILIVLGILLIATSITMLVGSSGISAPLSALAVTLGLNLVKPVVIGAIASASFSFGGGFTFWGTALIKQSNPKGFSKELIEVQEEIINRTPSSPY
jgi:hypothetical protein